MNQLATCLRCSAPLTAGNAQAVNPDVCIACPAVSDAPAAATSAAAPTDTTGPFVIPAHEAIGPPAGTVTA